MVWSKVTVTQEGTNPTGLCRARSHCQHQQSRQQNYNQVLVQFPKTKGRFCPVSLKEVQSPLALCRHRTLCCLPSLPGGPSPAGSEAGSCAGHRIS